MAREHRRTRRRTPLRVAWVGLVALALASAPLLDAGEKKIRLDYTRSGPRQATRKATSRKSLPRNLEIKPGNSSTRSSSGSSPTLRQATPQQPPAGQQGQAHPSRRLSREVELYRQARAASRWTADWLVEGTGVREYFRVGFYEGLREALHDPSLGEEDYRQGERLGWRDERARREGRAIGRSAAFEIAGREAEARVIAQFHDLDGWPEYAPRPGRPAYVPVLPYIAEPTLEEVFAEYPFDPFPFGDERTVVFLRGWSHDAAELYRLESHAPIYDDGWLDADAAFARWAEMPHEASYLHGLTVNERQLFGGYFADGFGERLAALYLTHLLPAFEHGFDEGWAYGAFVHQEWDYRRGFHSGFVEGLEDEAHAGFYRAYADQYDIAYRVHFEEWSHNPKPEIGEVWLVDGSDDGVFEPGEELFVDYEVINYGGGRGRFELQLQGRMLTGPGHSTIELPRRSIVRAQQMLAARIEEHTPIRTRAELRLLLADRVRELDLSVNRPLQLRRGAWRVRRSNLDGQVVLELDVENISRRPVPGQVDLATTALPGYKISRALGAVEPGQVRRLALPVDGLDPLDLLGGWVTLEVELLGAEKLHDSFRYHIPDAARDLSNRDLLTFIIDLAQADPIPPDRIATARDLLMTRLREDWKVAVARRGNPYKYDFRHHATTTALGDLVQTYRLQAPDIREHAVFAQLSSEVLTLADRLPGIHPFLRKYVRKLARELP